MANYMLIRHKVTDFKTWKAGYDADRSNRIEAGLTEKYVLRNTDDPNEVVALFEAQDLNRAKAFATSADLREKMQKVGVVDKPDIYFLNS
ncbi:MAG: cyclase [Burkholderiales bacterium]|nr:cyclase [Burkholderiales bacterium]